MQLHEGAIDDLDSAQALCDDLISFYRKKGLKCRQIKALAQKGICLSSASSYEQSLKNILEAQRKYDQSTCNEQILAFINLAYSQLYINMREFDKVDSICLSTIRMFQPSWPDKISLIKLYMNIGFGEADLYKVLPYLDTAYNLAVEYNYPSLQQKALISIGSMYAMMDSVDKAEANLKLALKVARKRGDLEYLGYLFNNLAGLARDDREILINIDSAIYYAKQNHSLRNEQTFLENKAYFLYHTKKYKEAYTQLWKAVELKDTLIELDRYEAVVELEKKYEAEKKSNEIQALKLKNLNTEVEKLTYKRNQNTLIVGSLILLIILGILAINFITIRKNRNLLAQKNTELSKERKRSDDLLLNILPEEIALELKATGKAKAKQFEVASILFTDFIEFTQTTETLSTEDLVKELNFCFMSFDHILEKYGLEKIKTIGDSYMAAGGLPVPSESATKNTVLAALEMQSFIMERRAMQQSLGKPSFEMRTGISTGPAVAGIVGVKKFQYDIWGDTVNTASRMESMGEANKVNISQSTYDLIKRDPQFVFENRGYVEAKGKGKIAMYFVELA